MEKKISGSVFNGGSVRVELAGGSLSAPVEPSIKMDADMGMEKGIVLYARCGFDEYGGKVPDFRLKLELFEVPAFLGQMTAILQQMVERLEGTGGTKPNSADGTEKAGFSEEDDVPAVDADGRWMTMTKTKTKDESYYSGMHWDNGKADEDEGR